MCGLLLIEITKPFKLSLLMFFILATPIHFTVTPSPDISAARNSMAKKYAYLTRVTTGDCAKGQQGYTRAPFNNISQRQYDSVQDVATKTFIVFSRRQAYPEYLISYKWRTAHATILDHVYVDIPLYVCSNAMQLAWCVTCNMFALTSTHTHICRHTHRWCFVIPLSNRIGIVV